MTVKLIIVNTDACRGLLSCPERFCSALRLERTAGIKSERLRLERYAAELALSYALSGEALLPPEYCYEECGRPVIANGYVSLSHSGKYAVCAYFDAPVGVDIEQERNISGRIAQRVLTEREREAYAAFGNDYLLRRFVMKEAYFKLTGEGLGGGFGDIDAFDGKVYRRGAPAGFVEFEPIENAVCCAAAYDEFELEALFLSDDMLKDPVTE